MSTSPAERTEAGYFALLHADPVVLAGPDWEVLHPTSAMWSVLEALPDRPVYLAVYTTWTLLEGHAMWQAPLVRQLLQRFNHLRVVTCCTTAGEAAAAQREGLATLHCSSSALIRAEWFTPGLRRQPTFDAIYDARWSDYKRHDLAGDVRSLALIAAPSGEWAPCTIDYMQRAHDAVRHATWITSPWGSTRWLSYEQVDAAYGQARVGLCLSRVEGEMNASIQYLMAGLPIVTTPSLGGRDEFFDPLYVRWVDPEPKAVGDAVKELVSLNLDPQIVREAALARVKRHRDRMQAWIREAILAEGGELGRWDRDWPKGLPNKFREPLIRAADVIAEINEMPSH